MKKFTTQNLNSVISQFRSYARFSSCVAFCFLAFFSFSRKAAAVDVSNYQSEIQAIENYLNNITTLKAKFVQKTSEGQTIEGKFFLSRPGKMRIEYVSQPPIVIVVNGAVLSYFDVELDEISRLSTNSTPASLLTRPNISFSAKDVEITSIKKTDNQIKISLMKKNRKEAGEFSIVFEMNPLKFVRMEVKNDLDQVISVTLHDVELGKAIADSAFILKKSNK